MGRSSPSGYRCVAAAGQRSSSPRGMFFARPQAQYCCPVAACVRPITRFRETRHATDLLCLRQGRPRLHSLCCRVPPAARRCASAALLTEIESRIRDGAGPARLFDALPGPPTPRRRCPCAYRTFPGPAELVVAVSRSVRERNDDRFCASSRTPAVPSRGIYFPLQAWRHGVEAGCECPSQFGTVPEPVPPLELRADGLAADATPITGRLGCASGISVP